MERLLSSAEQEWTESEGKRTVNVVAPGDGIVTTVGGEPGQTVNATQLLANIIPSGSTLQARLYAPSRGIGFVRPGVKVLLRYQAYPYQKFGQAQGTVESVARTVMTSDELVGELGTASREPVFQITVSLEQQTFPVYGKREPLQAGMLLEADILQERRKLFEWVLEPIYSISGKI